MNATAKHDDATLDFTERVLGYPVVVAEGASHVAHLIGMRVRLIKAGRADATPPVEPTRPWATAAKKATSPLSNGFRNHSLRTWCFGLALAKNDNVQLDREDLYVAALLHDLGLFAPQAGRCFTAAGAAAALSTASKAGVADDRATAVAEAIASHIDLGDPPTKLGKYVKAGSLLDVAGTRVWDLDSQSVKAVYALWPGQGFGAELTDRWKSECRRFPRGRANFAPVRLTVPWAARHAPLPRT